MKPNLTDPAANGSSRVAPVQALRRYSGEVVYIYAFDLAYEMDRVTLKELLGQPVAQFSVDTSRRKPRQLFFYRPQMVRLPPLERIGPLGAVRVERTVKILPVGAISITVRIPFGVDEIEDLVGFHDLRFTNGVLHQEVRQLAEEIRAELRPFLVRPRPHLTEEEAYTVFCINAPLLSTEGLALNAEDWFAGHRRKIASLLTQEPQADRLSRQESDESTARHLSYYEHDLVVVDWDAALVVDEPANFDETLHAMELANLQLAELEAYDLLLDDALDRSYRDLSREGKRPRRDVLREIRELRVDLARFSDELLNITKFFGDWHLARVYETVSLRFHLPDWHHMLDEKLKTLDHLYEILQHDQNNRWMLILESTIVLLFIIDLVLLFVGLGGK